MSWIRLHVQNAGETMRIISVIDDQEVIKSILDHFGLRLIRSRPRAKAHASPVREYVAGDSCPTTNNNYCSDPD